MLRNGLIGIVLALALPTTAALAETAPVRPATAKALKQAVNPIRLGSVRRASAPVKDEQSLQLAPSTTFLLIGGLVAVGAVVALGSEAGSN